MFQTQQALEIATRYPPALLLAATRHPLPPRLLHDRQHLRRCRCPPRSPLAPNLGPPAAMILAAKRGQVRPRQRRSLAVGKKRVMLTSVSLVMPSPSSSRLPPLARTPPSRPPSPATPPAQLPGLLCLHRAALLYGGARALPVSSRQWPAARLRCGAGHPCQQFSQSFRS